MWYLIKEVIHCIGYLYGNETGGSAGKNAQVGENARLLHLGPTWATHLQKKLKTQNAAKCMPTCCQHVMRVRHQTTLSRPI